MRQSLRRPGGLAAFCQNGEELFDAGGGVGKVEPERAAGHQDQGLQQGNVGEEARAKRQGFVVAHLTREARKKDK